MSQFIYFIQAGAAGPVKIGISDNPERRLQQLQGAHHEELRLLSSVEGTVWAERRIHALLEEHRLRGEWFAPDPIVLATVDRAERIISDYTQPTPLHRTRVAHGSVRAKELLAIQAALTTALTSEEHAAAVFAEAGREIWFARKEEAVA